MGGRVNQNGITEPQRAALARLSSILPGSVYLTGGVAIAARYSHRTSRDLGLFTPDDPVELVLPSLERMEGVVITLKKPRTIYLTIDGIPTSILSYEYPHLARPDRVEGVAVPLASVPDLITMKLSAIADRGARRDFWDLHELLVRNAIPLADALDLQRRRYPQYDIGHVVRALVYFADAESAPFPAGLTEDRWSEIRRDFEVWVRAYASA